MITGPLSSNGAKKEQSKSFFSDPSKFINYEDMRPQDRLNQSESVIPQVKPATETIEQPEIKKRTANDIVKEILSFQAPQPTYDPQRPEEIKRIGRVNAIGEGIKTIGDIVSLGAGANVNRRAPDQVTPNMLSALWQNRDKAAAQKDNWNYQNYLTKLRNAQAELGQINLEKKFEADLAEKDRELKYKSGRDSIEDAFKKNDDDEQKRHNTEMEKNGRIKEKQADKENLPVKIQTANKVYELTPEKAAYYRGEALSRIDTLAKNHPGWLSKKPELDPEGDPTGRYTFQISNDVKDTDLIRAYLEMIEDLKDANIPGLTTSVRPSKLKMDIPTQKSGSFRLPGFGKPNTSTKSNTDSKSSKWSQYAR